MHKEKKKNPSAQQIQKKLDELIKKKEQENAVLKQLLEKEVKRKNN